MFCSIMDFKLKEIKTINEFIGKETLEKMKMVNIPKHIREHFKIVPSESVEITHPKKIGVTDPKNGIWKYGKKE